ncbi:MAG: polysaccharide export protein [Verrucomicrobia bacterium]|nr:polysaccharide export protein [Verrucomicrobiota bacterium]
MKTHFSIIGCVALFCAIALAPDAFSQAAKSVPSRSGGSGYLKDYRVLPLDVLSISVFQEKELEREAKVTATGYITFPLLGKVQVGGLLVSEVETKLADLLGRDYIKNPQVSVIVKEYSARSVSVLGEVKNPGKIDFPPEGRLTLLQALARAGGVTSIAKTDAVVITRRSDDGREQKIEVNATDMMRSKSEKKDIDLEPDDVIFVPTRFF